jgi:porin
MPLRNHPLPCRLALSAAMFIACQGGPARATPPAGGPSQSVDESGQPIQNEGQAGFLSNMQRSSYMLGDMGGLRTLLAKYGMSLTIAETSEVLGNISGGVHQGFEYDGLTLAVLQLDTQRAFGLHGGTFNISGLQIHGRNLSADNLSTLQTSSGIEADRSTRLWELWYQQKFLDEDRLDIKIGQQSLDQEFMVSQNALLFVNTMFGWPLLPSYDMPGGGPAYPLSAPGVRLRAHPTDSITVLGGLFAGSPVTKDFGDPQKQNPSGTTFPINNNLLAIAEIQFAYPSVGMMVEPDQPEPLARTIRLGAWYDGQRFADQRYDTDGLSLANPASNGDPRSHRGDFAVYGVLDQMLYRDAVDADETINFFTRAMGTPLTDRNLIEFSLNAGLTMHDPIPHRDDDTVGIGMGYGKVSNYAGGLDRDTAAFSGAFTPQRTDETFIEATYQYQLTPWCQVQPDFQYIFNPGGGLENPNIPGHRIHDEAVFGVRVNILF